MRPLMPLQMKASKEEGYRSQHILSDLVIWILFFSSSVEKEDAALTPISRNVDGIQFSATIFPANVQVSFVKRQTVLVFNIVL